MKIVKGIITRIWIRVFKNARLSYSQSGEDMILDTIFCNVSNGTYVDVGANNPYIQSNTHFLYKKGWRGINIDALPGSMKIFKKIRPQDINLEVAISNDEKELTYYMFNSSFYNTFFEKDVEKNKEVTKFIGSIKIKTIKLEKIFDSLKLQNIDFLSIDVEGLDLDVLKSNNWIKYRPRIIVVEKFSEGLDLLINDKIYQFLNEIGYCFLCNTVTNAFYIEDTFFKQRFVDS
jgi:FkbM family methyltransferase